MQDHGIDRMRCREENDLFALGGDIETGASDVVLPLCEPFEDLGERR
jgi:hypothetical protein